MAKGHKGGFMVKGASHEASKSHGRKKHSKKRGSKKHSKKR